MYLVQKKNGSQRPPKNGSNYMFHEKLTHERLTSNYTLINVPLKENINGPIIWFIICSKKN